MSYYITNRTYSTNINKSPNIPIFTFKHVSLLSITSSQMTIYNVTPIRLLTSTYELFTSIFPSHNNIPTIFTQIYLGHTIIPSSTTSTCLGIHNNKKLTFYKQILLYIYISKLKAFTFHHLFNINKIRPYITTSTALTNTQT